MIYINVFFQRETDKLSYYSDLILHEVEELIRYGNFFLIGSKEIKYGVFVKKDTNNKIPNGVRIHIEVLIPFEKTSYIYENQKSAIINFKKIKYVLKIDLISRYAGFITDVKTTIVDLKI